MKNIDATNDSKAAVRYDASSGCIVCCNVADGSEITVSHVSGSVVGTATSYGNCAAVPVCGQSSGVYIVVIRNNSDNSTYKVFKQ